MASWIESLNYLVQLLTANRAFFEFLAFALGAKAPVTAGNAYRIYFVYHTNFADFWFHVRVLRHVKIKRYGLIYFGCLQIDKLTIGQYVFVVLLAQSVILPRRRPTILRRLDAFRFILIVVNVHEVIVVIQFLCVRLLQLSAVQFVLVKHLAFYEVQESVLVDAGTSAGHPVLRCKFHLSLVVVFHLFGYSPWL